MIGGVKPQLNVKSENPLGDELVIAWDQTWQEAQDNVINPFDNNKEADENWFEMKGTNKKHNGDK